MNRGMSKMSFGFYKTDRHVLEFDCKNEIHKIVFNHYIMRKVNYHRMKGDLPNGQFKMTGRSASVDLNLSRTTVIRLINEFEEKNIINLVERSTNGKTSSVYNYMTISNGKVMQKPGPVSGPICETVDGQLEISDFKDLSQLDESVGVPVDGPVSGPSKIENINRELNKNNIYCRVVEYLNKKTGKRFKSSSNKTMSMITARLNDDFVEEDFYKVIDIKCDEWKDTAMEIYLRPETLFSNKFEGYLNQMGNPNLREDDKAESYKIDFRY